MKRLLLIAALLLSQISFAQVYCTNPGPITASVGYINNVKLNTINNSSTYNSPTGYSNYSGISTTVGDGLSYTITINNTRQNTGNPYYYYVWVDYNRNGSFGDAGEKVFETTVSTTAASVSGSFTNPANYLGATKVRVIMSYYKIYTACDQINYGEVEDYSYNIVHCGGVPTPTINGNTDLCYAAADQVYSLIGVADNTTYNWTLINNDPNMAVFTPDQSYYHTGTSATVHTDRSQRAGSFTLQVQGVNVCGQKSQVASTTVWIRTSVPPAFTGVYGPANVCNAGPVSYYQPKPAGQYANVTWEISPSTAVASYPYSLYGQLNVDWNDSYVGWVTARCRQWNGCGYSAWSPTKSTYVSPGTCAASNISRVGDEDAAMDITSTDGMDVTISPNPSAGAALLEINNAISDGSVVEVYDINGASVYKNENVTTEKGISFGENIQPGIYTVKVISGSVVKVLKFIKQ